ncbi:hypothetical protein KPL40_19650, partial [Clostridium gasigenes]|uniref:hypothetical protein n=1 Tax=Clostridium gasigenes TaxID=94869 RepID=UPI001C0E8C19
MCYKMKFKKQIISICLVTFLTMSFIPSKKASAFFPIVIPIVWGIEELLQFGVLALCAGVVLTDDDQAYEVAQLTKNAVANTYEVTADGVAHFTEQSVIKAKEFWSTYNYVSTTTTYTKELFRADANGNFSPTFKVLPRSDTKCVILGTVYMPVGSRYNGTTISSWNAGIWNLEYYTVKYDGKYLYSYIFRHSTVANANLNVMVQEKTDGKIQGLNLSGLNGVVGSR